MLFAPEASDLTSRLIETYMWPTFSVLFCVKNKTQKVGHIYVTIHIWPN